MSARHAPATRRDRGSVLPMVLVFMVVGTLIVIPLLTYASTVLRVNTVSVEKTETIERVRGGARVSVARPADLFVRCSGGTTSVPVPGSVSPTSTTCRQLSQVSVLNALEVPFGAAAMQLDETVPAAFSYSSAAPPTGSVNTWWGDATDTSCTVTGGWCPDPKQDTIWIPPLPEVASSIQEATGYPMPAPRNCTVFFPGTYNDPVTLSGPTYFVSGVYLFNANLTVVGGADVVMGFGIAEGCVGNDNAAVLDMYPNPLPLRINHEGNGATLMFGDEAQLIVDDAQTVNGSGVLIPNAGNTPVRFEINQRYIENVSDTAARVSIMSVNGDVDVVNPVPNPPVTATVDLDVVDEIFVPESVVKTSTGTFVRAGTKGLVPSSLTPEPRAPETPKNVVLEPLRDRINTGNVRAIGVSWLPPVGNDEGGSTITRYEVKATPGPYTCRTDGATECLLLNLPRNTTYNVTVTATNDVGTSDPSAPQTIRPESSDPDVVKAARPTSVTVTDPTTYLNAAKISWVPPTSDGNAPIVGYRVKAYRSYKDVLTGLVKTTETTPVGQCETFSFRLIAPATSCVLSGLPALDGTPGNGPPNPLPGLTTWTGYRFTVTTITATTNAGLPTTPVPTANKVAESDPSTPTDPPVLAFTGSTTYVNPNPNPPVWPIAPTYVPDPILDVNLAGSATSNVSIAGYIAVPQGRVQVRNTSGRPLDLIGGVVAAAFDVDPATLAAMGAPSAPTKIGFEDVVLQRTIELTTRAPGERITSTMRVQINANGADIRVNSWVIE